jgi:hypothetical protein
VLQELLLVRLLVLELVQLVQWQVCTRKDLKQLLDRGMLIPDSRTASCKNQAKII